jgi:ketosteroid isomerase-like protein
VPALLNPLILNQRILPQKMEFPIMLSADDKIAIAELLARASYAYDQRDLELLESGFCEDAVVSLCIAGGDLVGPFEGRDNVMQLYLDAMASQNDVRRHVVSNSFFSVSDDVVEVTSNLTLFATEEGKTKLLSAGLYRDTVRQVDNQWRIATRHVDLDSAY